MCGTIKEIDVDGNAYAEWRSKQKYIQDAFPNLSAREREQIKTGFCFDCQDILFAEPYGA